MMRAKPATPESISSGEMGRHRTILENERVRAWYERVSLKSRLSADSNIRKLGLLLERLDLSPEHVQKLASENPDHLAMLLVRYARDQKEKGRLDTYILKTFDGLRSFLESCHVKFDDFPGLNATRGESLEHERVPAPEELGRVLEHLSLRGRTIALLMAHAGLRPGSIGSYGGEKGLILSDLKDLEATPTAAKFREVPFMIRVRAELSKIKTAYTTFGTQQLANVLLAYLESRRKTGERLTPNSAVIGAFQSRGVAKRSREAAQFGNGFLTTKAITEEIREALNAAKPSPDIRWRPYVLRSYCSTRLLIAEGSGKISRDLREAILGHDGGVAARYNVGKPWGKELLFEARAAYLRCEPFLSTIPSSTQVGRDKGNTEFMLRYVGVPQSELDKVDVSTKSNDELLALAEKYKPTQAAIPHRSGQRAVPVAEVGPMLEAGWEYVAPLGNDRAVLRIAPQGSDLARIG